MSRIAADELEVVVFSINPRETAGIMSSDLRKAYNSNSRLNGLYTSRS